MFQLNKNKFLKALITALEFLAVILIIYLLALPFWPVLKYKFIQQKSGAKVDWQNIETAKEEIKTITSHLPEAESRLSANRLLIPKIGVHAPIIESPDSQALEKGIWRLPESSTPDKGGNTVLTGHRFKYLPPNNLTLYLLDKLKTGDIISVVWQGREYLYRLKEIKIVSKDDLSILSPSQKPLLTIFTCHPLFSQEKRLAVIGELVEI